MEFRDALFSNLVSFDGARFSGGHVSFNNATVKSGLVEFPARFSGGEVSFTFAEFIGGAVQFAFAEFSGGRITFVGAKFRDGRVSFVETEFSGSQVSLGLAEFSGGEVSFGSAKFLGGEVEFNGAKFQGGEVNFAEAGFLGGQVNFANVEKWTKPPTSLPRDATGLTLPKWGTHRNLREPDQGLRRPELPQPGQPRRDDQHSSTPATTDRRSVRTIVPSTSDSLPTVRRLQIAVVDHSPAAPSLGPETGEGIAGTGYPARSRDGHGVNSWHP